MTWFLIAIIGPILYALTNFIDKLRFNYQNYYEFSYYCEQQQYDWEYLAILYHFSEESLNFQQFC